MSFRLNDRLRKTEIVDADDEQLGIWGSGGITTVDEIHYRINNSREWFASHCFSAVADDASVYVHVKTGAKTVHGDFSIASDGTCLKYFYESPTTTGDGTGLTEYCMNRQTDATPTATLFHTPTSSANGTQLQCGVIGSGGKKIGAGGVITEAYWLLKVNTSYLIKVTNISGTASEIVIQYEWHEHEHI